MKNFLTKGMPACVLLCIILSCSKSSDIVNDSNDTKAFRYYIINQGEHYCQQTSYTPGEFRELKFFVKFDSTAIYTTVKPENQYDINKLYGFSDNGSQHHEFSARIGWRWSDGALRLFGYIYNNGVPDYQEIATVSIGEIHECAIKISASNYIFSVNGHSLTMPRSSLGESASGYQLFPYYGGDETAPHDIHIWIKDK